MKRPQQYFVFNKSMDYRRGWMDNIQCTGSHIQVEHADRQGIFWSRLLDSGEGETVWQSLSMDISSRSEISVSIAIYSSEEASVMVDGHMEPLADVLKNAPHEEKLEISQPYLVKTAFRPRDILLHQVKGRYVWFCLTLMAQGSECPQVGNLTLRLPKESWVTYLPEIYEESDFTTAFLAIYQSLYDDLTADIRQVARYFDPHVVGGEYLEWLSTWLGIEDGYLWPEDKLRRLIGEGVALYGSRGTKDYVVRMVELFTGHRPYVVEQADVEPFLGDVQKSALLGQLYGHSPHTVTLVLAEDALESMDSYKALLRIVERATPAWLEVNVVVLKPYIFLNQYTYLGINTRLEPYRPLHLDGYSALPFTQLGT